MARQCLARRIPEIETLSREIDWIVKGAKQVGNQG